MDTNQITQINDLLDQVKTVLVIIGNKSDQDVLAAATSLYKSLQVADKDVSLLASRKPENSFGIAGASDIKTEIGNQNLTISFDYNEEAVDKVSYHIGEETNKFYLTIKPKKGSQPLQSDSVDFSYTGAEADLIFSIGVTNLEDLEQLYFGYEKLFRDTPIISLNTYQTSFGTVKLDTVKGVGYSEVVGQLLVELELVIQSQNATELLHVLELTSNHFQSPRTTATTFELAAQLLKAGAQRTAKMPDQEARVNDSKVQEFEINQKDDKKNSDSNKQKSTKHKKKAGGLDYQPSAGSVSRN